MPSVYNMNRITTSAKINGLTWAAWWQVFVSLAQLNGYRFGCKDEYFEYWEDGDSPEDALTMETK